MMDTTDFSDLGDFLGEAFDDVVSHDPALPALSVTAAIAEDSPSSSFCCSSSMMIQYAPISPDVSGKETTTASSTADLQRVLCSMPPAPELTATLGVDGHCISPTPSVAGESSSDEADDAVSSSSSSASSSNKINKKKSTSPAKRARSSTIKKTSTTANKAVSSSSASSVGSDDNNSDDDVIKKKIRRRERNREHAKKCRSRKKNYLKTLEDSVIDLRRDNDKLRRLILTKFTKEEIGALVQQDPTIASALKAGTAAAAFHPATVTSADTAINAISSL